MPSYLSVILFEFTTTITNVNGIRALKKRNKSNITHHRQTFHNCLRLNINTWPSVPLPSVRLICVRLTIVRWSVCSDLLVLPPILARAHVPAVVYTYGRLVIQIHMFPANSSLLI